MSGQDSPSERASEDADATTSAGFAAIRRGGFVLITPLDPPARDWLRTHANVETTWLGETLVVEPAYLPELADAIGIAGFRLERET